MKSFFGKKLKAILQNLQIFKIGLLEIVVIVIQQKWSIRTIILLWFLHVFTAGAYGMMLDGVEFIFPDEGPVLESKAGDESSVASEESAANVGPPPSSWKISWQMALTAEPFIIEGLMRWAENSPNDAIWILPAVGIWSTTKTVIVIGMIAFTILRRWWGL